MSASSAQLDANRANSQLSTGPKSIAGKATASRNSRKHGLTGAFFFLDPQDEADFELLRIDLVAEHCPAGASEKMLVEDIAVSWWKLRRAVKIHHEAVLESPDDIDKILKYERYENAARRGYQRALTLLQQARKNRVAHPPVSRAGEALRAVMAAISPDLNVDDSFALFADSKFGESLRADLRQSLADFKSQTNASSDTPAESEPPPALAA